MLWSGTMKCDVVWSGVVRCGVVKCGVWCGVMRCGMKIHACAKANARALKRSSASARACAWGENFGLFVSASAKKA